MKSFWKKDEVRKIDEPFEPSKRQVVYTNQALEELERFSSDVDRFIHDYVIKIAKNRSTDLDKDIEVSYGDAIEAIDSLRYDFGREFFEFTEES